MFMMMENGSFTHGKYFAIRIVEPSHLFRSWWRKKNAFPCDNGQNAIKNNCFLLKYFHLHLSVVCSKLLTLMRFTAIFSDCFRIDICGVMRKKKSLHNSYRLSTIQTITLWLHHATIFRFWDCWNWASTFFSISICESSSFSLSPIDLIECYNLVLLYSSSIPTRI